MLFISSFSSLHVSWLNYIYIFILKDIKDVFLNNKGLWVKDVNLFQIYMLYNSCICWK